MLSVIMPVFNLEKFILESVKSILNQTYTNFELIIVDDGSVDKTLEIIKKIKDNRIKIIKNKSNLGLSPSLNTALDNARGKYIVRCDGDDLNEPNRFKQQFEFLESHPDYVLVGSNAQVIDKVGNKIGQIKTPEDDREIKLSLLTRNIIIHPSVMVRTEDLKRVGGYRMLFNFGGEDYDLWFRLFKFGKFKNIQKNLIRRRIHENVYTKKHHLRIEIFTIFVRTIHLFSWYKLLI